MKKICLLCDPRELDSAKRIRYIGVSKNPINRLRGHISSARRGDDHPCSIWIRELLSVGISPTLEPVVDLNLSEAEAIRHWTARGAALTNISRGISKKSPPPSVRLWSERSRKILINAIGKRIRTLRLEERLSLEHLAILAGITYQALSRYEHGLVLADVNTIEKIAKALKCKAGWLAYGDEK